MASRPKIYIDACTFIDLVKYQVGAGVSSERERDAWHVLQLLAAARAGELDVLTSVLSIAECTHVSSEPHELQARAFFGQLFESGRSGVKLVQPTSGIARNARDLRWIQSISLRGADALHVASALEMRCDEILTRDRRILAASAALRTNGIEVLVPSETTRLPEEYRQTGLQLNPPRL